MFQNFTTKNIIWLLIGIVIIVWFSIWWFQPAKLIQPYGPIQSAATSDKAYTLYYFYNPNCLYCQRFTPTWNMLKQRISNPNIILTEIDGTQDQNQNLLFYFNINSFPTIILSGNQIIPYTGDRSLADLERFINQHVTS